MQELISYLESNQPGPLSATREFQGLLAGCWDEFDGSGAEGMAAYKLIDRMEDLFYEPPVLRFIIERHGGTVLGSSRAARYAWEVDLEGKSASCELIGYRQLKPMRPRHKVGPIAEEIAPLITNRMDDPRLKWNGNKVQIKIGEVIPDVWPVRKKISHSLFE